MAYALLIIWRDGQPEYLRDPVTRTVEAFATVGAASDRRRRVREVVAWGGGAAGAGAVSARRRGERPPAAEPRVRGRGSRRDRRGALSETAREIIASPPTS